MSKLKNNHNLKDIKCDKNPYTNLEFSESYYSLMKVKKKLPIFSIKEELKNFINDNKVIILEGETGSGKTTQIPQYLVEFGYTKNNKKIICTQPRRVAAISVAKRVSLEMDVDLGEQVGYSVRFDEKTSKNTFLKYCTEGMLLRELITDPNLNKYSAVIIDEAHERTTNTDILLGILKEILNKRDDIKVIVMSATLDTKKFQDYFSAPLKKISGKMFEVDILYTKDPESDYVEAAINTALYIHTEEDTGDILIFLTGEDEIEYACERIREEIDLLNDDVGDVLILPLYSGLLPKDQMKIFNKCPRPNLKNIPGRKIIVSTNIAETSLTIDGIVYVIDSGFCKQKIFNPRLRIDTLLVTPISKANAKQRSGRAGRTKPGKCYRLYNQESYDDELKDTPYPEILRTNLNSLILYLKKLNIINVAKFDFIDPPSPETMMRCLENLFYLNAISMKGELTDLGSKMIELPIDPYLSRTIFASIKYKCLEEVLSICSILSVQNIFLKNYSKKNYIKNIHSKFVDKTGDHLTLLFIMQNYEKSNEKQKFCRENFLSFKNLKFSLDIKKQLKSTLYKEFKIKSISLPLSSPKYAKNILKSLLIGYFANIAYKMNKDTYIWIKDNQMVLIHPSCYLEYKSEFIMYNELVLTSKNYVRVVSEINPKWILKLTNNYYDIDKIKNQSVKKKLLDLKSI